MKEPSDAVENREPRPAIPTSQLEGVRPFQILVRLFADQRHPVPLALQQSQHALGADGLPDLFRGVVPDRAMITGLFMMALKRAGYDPKPMPAGLDQPLGSDSGQVVLEGQVWSFRYERRGATMLEVDVSLLLHRGGGGQMLWRTEFPEDTRVPLWIGLGCESQDMLHESLKEVEESAFLCFAKPEFARAVRRAALSSSQSDALPEEGSHQVIHGTSWTGTDEGEIKASARSSCTLGAGDQVPAPDLGKTSLQGAPNQHQLPAKPSVAAPV